MRIAYLLDQFPVLSQTFVIGEIEDHLRAGLDVQVFSLSRPPKADVVLAQLGPLFEGRVTYLAARGRNDRVGDLALAALADLARGGVGLASAMSQESAMRARAWTFDKIARWRAAGPQADVVHAHFGNIGRLGARLKAMGLLPGKLVVTFHAAELSKHKYGDLAARYRELFAQGDLVLPISEHWRDKLVELGCPPARIHVQRMGVNLSALPVAANPGSGPLRLVGLGRFVEKKGHAFTVRALAAARARRPDLDLRLDLGGDGPLLAEVQAEAAALGVAQAVIFHGAVSHAEALRLIGEGNVFILPSVTAADGDMEGIPVVLMEAMALGRPAISTLHSGIPELVLDGRTGLLAPERDVGALADAILALAEAPELRTRFGEAGRAHVETAFDRHRLGAQLRTHYACP